MTGPEITALDAAAYVIPTDVPAADGTLTWDKTTVMVVRAKAGNERGTGWSYTAAAAANVVGELLTAAGLARFAARWPGQGERLDFRTTILACIGGYPWRRSHPSC
ncbi:MAG TPA: hypothetical protein VFQ68_14195 [Streptosporangiaceae bacterium]|nr:hypothetical protein [Streptosporangiaceae bacterium]